MFAKIDIFEKNRHFRDIREYSRISQVFARDIRRRKYLTIRGETRISWYLEYTRALKYIAPFLDALDIGRSPAFADACLDLAEDFLEEEPGRLLLADFGRSLDDD